ncbi:ATP-binding protein [Chitinophaga horti]|uniref:ATP-binding protein n=1 Tax=Chitinophaga horti TaxID=2920382 RepID=A0ABY6J1I0_9BACT|nr:ATP-binding protein [Chitinophaga horti]UYQ93544.1 ATP-binding protein [Chitinophaga horti]
MNELMQAINQLAIFIQARLAAHFSHKEVDTQGYVNDIAENTSALPAFAPFSPTEQVILLLALMPHLQPGFFESIIQQYLPQGGDFPEFGGAKGNNHRGMLPTGETAVFLLAGRNIFTRQQLHAIFADEGVLYQEGVLTLGGVKDGEPAMSGRLVLSPEWLHQVLVGKELQPRFSPEFPARRLRTKMNWEDAVLHPITREQIGDIRTWLQYQHEFRNDANLSRKVKPGYRALFYGPSGTGKTLTATLLGKQFGQEVYRIDLSQVVSKYIGETEKNLEKVFTRAENKNWILFFDEADALFGKRTNVQSAHDRFANQEVSYLLQRVEEFPGLMILASNFKNNLDEAFLRRFHAIIHFPVPNEEERRQLWEKSLPASLKLSPGVDVKQLSARFDLTGAAILNVMQYATLRAFARGDGQLQLQDVLEGVRKELAKEEKSL